MYAARSRRGTHSAEDVAEILTGGATPATIAYQPTYMVALNLVCMGLVGMLRQDDEANQ